MEHSKKDKKVSIILIHYNQRDYIEGAIDSIFNQTYKNIELIFADDASMDLEIDWLKDHISKVNKNNYTVKYQLNKENLGTVKSLNKAITKCEGDYILIFAADDKLYDENVISNFVNLYEEQEDDVAIVFGQCNMMDITLTKLLEKFINVAEAKRFNSLSAKDQYQILVSNCFAAMGACMLDANILKELGGFDNRFNYIEDWTYFLEVTKNNYRMIYGNFTGLLHRDGGISHNDGASKLRIAFVEDLLRIYELKVFPMFYTLDYTSRKKALDNYRANKDVLKKLNVYHSNDEYDKLKIKYVGFFIKRKLDKMCSEYMRTLVMIRDWLFGFGILIILAIELKNYFYITSTLFDIGMYFAITGFSALLLLVILLTITKLLSQLRIIKFK